jgi:hypothetical protein
VNGLCSIGGGDGPPGIPVSGAGGPLALATCAMPQVIYDPADSWAWTEVGSCIINPGDDPAICNAAMSAGGCQESVVNENGDVVFDIVDSGSYTRARRHHSIMIVPMGSASGVYLHAARHDQDTVLGGSAERNVGHHLTYVWVGPDMAVTSSYDGISGVVRRWTLGRGTHESFTFVPTGVGLDTPIGNGAAFAQDYELKVTLVLGEPVEVCDVDGTEYSETGDGITNIAACLDYTLCTATDAPVPFSGYTLAGGSFDVRVYTGQSGLRAYHDEFVAPVVDETCMTFEGGYPPLRYPSFIGWA